MKGRLMVPLTSESAMSLVAEEERSFVEEVALILWGMAEESLEIEGKAPNMGEDQEHSGKSLLTRSFSIQSDKIFQCVI